MNPNVDALRSYHHGGGNKALAVGTNGTTGAVWNHSSKEGAAATALKQCVSAGGINCRVVEINGNPVDHATNLPVNRKLRDAYEHGGGNKKYCLDQRLRNLIAKN
jgi:hypothetical protein